jgi:ribonuclease HI
MIGRKELEPKAAEFLGFLEQEGERASIEGFHDYQVKISLSGSSGTFSIWYAPSRKAFSINTRELADGKAGRRIAALWDKFSGVKFAEENDLSGWHLFCDGSFREGSAPSWAFCAVRDGNVVHKKNGVCGPKTDPALRNIGAEIEAVKQGILWLQKEKVQSATIHYDYAGLEAWATGQWKAKNPSTQEYRDFFDTVRVRLTWNKVKGHSGHHFNDLVDRMAGNVKKKK